MTYEGRCPCGALGFFYTPARVPEAWSIRACQCSFCRAHGARCTSDPGGSVRFRVADAYAAGRYRFGLGTADFLFCRTCGVYVGALLATEHGDYATVNVNTLVRVVPGLPAAAPVSYEAESRKQRIARRQSRWTPVSGAVGRKIQACEDLRGHLGVLDRSQQA